MCDTIVEWLADISGCSVGEDHNILMDTVCSEMLKQWRIGSNASNLQIGRQGFTDHQKTENRLHEMREQDLRNRLLAARNQVRQAGLDVQRATNMAVRGDTEANEDDDTQDDNNRTGTEIDDNDNDKYYVG